MITISPIIDDSLLKKIFQENNLDKNENSSAVSAVFGEEVLGSCLFDIDDKSILVRSLSPKDDIMLADGILRAALHVAAERCAMNAQYAETAPIDVLDKLGFIKDQEKRTLDIDKLFGGCCCGK